MEWIKHLDENSEENLEIDSFIAKNDGEVWLPTFDWEGNEWFFLIQGLLASTEEGALEVGLEYESRIPVISLVSEIEPTGKAVPLYIDEYIPEGKETTEVRFMPAVIGNVNAGLIGGPLYDEVRAKEKAELN